MLQIHMNGILNILVLNQNTVQSKISSFLFSLTAKGGLNLSTIIYDKQNTDGEIFDPSNKKNSLDYLWETSGSIHTNYKLNNIGFLSLGYGYLYSINASNNC